VGQDLPPARAIINPRQPGCRYPFKELAGVGLAFKVAQALALAQQHWSESAHFDVESLLDLVALGTVADVVPLLGENRSLVRRGLEILNKACRPGVEALMANARLRRGDVDATAIGFRLGPRLNAAGRIKHALLAYELLASRDALKAQHFAQKLGKLNEERQKLTEETVTAAEAQVMADHPDAHLYMAASSDFSPGVVGLAASRLTESYYRPSIVVERGLEESRGSCRSIPEFHITRALDECSDLLIRHGGHAAAAGFTIATDRLDALRHRLQAIAAEQLAGVELRPTLEIDAQIPLEEVDWATYGLLSEMEPCGAENPQPVLLSPGVEVRDMRAVGSEQQHLKMTLRDGRGVAWDAIAFRQGNLLGQIPGRVNIAYTLERNDWDGNRRLQLNIQDLQTAD
jgi:single-stranded-DNA-specific exonuclease